MKNNKWSNGTVFGFGSNKSDFFNLLLVFNNILIKNGILVETNSNSNTHYNVNLIDPIK